MSNLTSPISSPMMSRRGSISKGSGAVSPTDELEGEDLSASSSNLNKGMSLRRLMLKNKSLSDGGLGFLGFIPIEDETFFDDKYELKEFLGE